LSNRLALVFKMKTSVRLMTLIYYTLSHMQLQPFNISRQWTSCWETWNYISILTIWYWGENLIIRLFVLTVYKLDTV